MKEGGGPAGIRQREKTVSAGKVLRSKQEEREEKKTDENVRRQKSIDCGGGGTGIKRLHIKSKLDSLGPL